MLILGGNGYLGSKISKKLLEDNHEVWCTKRRESDISRLKAVENIKWFDIDNGIYLSLFGTVQYDCVINCICNYGRNKSGNLDVMKSNFDSPLMFLEEAVKHNVKKFITIGTGLPDCFNIYSFSKKLFSEMGMFYAQKYNITFYNVLLEMFYGFDEPLDRFLPSITRKMINGEEINTTLGTQHRDIVSSEDVVEAICKLVNASCTGYVDIPIGTGVAPSISEVVDFLWNETDCKSKVNKGVIPMRNDEPDCVADVSVLPLLGIEWKPVFWKDGLREMISKIKEENA